MPQNERPVQKESPLLQWIGDTAVSLTPEAHQPRVRRTSTRQNNVEDLMKLAKQFDINMIQQGKEKGLEMCQGSSENHADGEHRPADWPENTSSDQHLETELNSLFSGPTQPLSGRLSPPSTTSSQGSKPEPVALSGKRSDLGLNRNIPASVLNGAEAKEPVKSMTSKTDFDEDWENDDLLNDSFVLEMTQNPMPLIVTPALDTAQMVPQSKKCDSVAKRSPLASARKAASTQSLHSSESNYNNISTNQKTKNQSTLLAQPNLPLQSKTVSTQVLSRRGLNTERAKSEESSHMHKTQRGVFVTEVSSEEEKKTKQSSGSEEARPAPDGPTDFPKDGLFDSDALWDDGEDDLFYKVCDDVERISASQEQQKDSNESHEQTHSGAQHRPSKTSPTDRIKIQVNTSNVCSKPAQQAGGARQPLSVLSRSISMPESSSGPENNQDRSSVSASHTAVINDGRQHRPEQLKNAAGPGAATPEPTESLQIPESRQKPIGKPHSSHLSTFKRHLSDPLALTNKVFVPEHRTGRCSAAEIERKKQEAIARRRSRMGATQNPGAP
ncbi:ewing's tumor-associated antigen 1 [Chanos chanos]|uniref:Ewing's tumor-associated antigen 1 n=1 Tax=Chanos chanos TaxID=29144 RepID=A0A6J2V9P0_CHACN|nr:ewing's tumor-associated antigen 1 [Chanos chanos]